MFGNIGWGETMVLLVAALVILGPERLPGAIGWTFGAIRKARDYATGATQQLRQDLGPEFDELRKPLSELQKLRGMSPRAVITQHLLNGDDSVLRDLESQLPSTGNFEVGSYDTFTPRPQQPLKAGERPPIDPDAT